MTNPASPLLPFSYRAQSSQGQILSGTIDAVDQSDAKQRLGLLDLRVLDLGSAVVAVPRASRSRVMGREDFAAFNEQLAQLARSGLPVEQGLRLVAEEMGSTPMRATLTEVADDLEAGKSLPQAIDAHRAQFPSLYANLVDAGIRSGNLPGILLNLGRHLTLVTRLQSALWRTFSYPLVVMVFFIGIFAFIVARLIPLFADMFRNFQLPLLTQWMIGLSQALSGAGLSIVLVVLAAIVILGFGLLWTAGRDRNVAEGFMLRIPMVGPILRRNLISRWCDIVSIGVEAGMDLPAAISIADDAIGSAALKADGEAIVAALTAGQQASASPKGRVLPPIVPAAIELASARNNLGEGLRGLSNLYQDQAELRIRSVQMILTPMIVIFMGIAVGILLLSVFAPMIALIETISSPHH
jgi:type II secretory pathway component PulF